MQVRSLGQEDPLEKEVATHSSILAWSIPWTEEPGGLQSMGSQRLKHDWSGHTHTKRHISQTPVPRLFLSFNSGVCFTGNVLKTEMRAVTFTSGKGMRGKAWYVAQPAQMLLLLMAIMCGQWLQSCLTLLNSMACSPPGSSVHGILQATVLEWVAISFSWGSSRPRDWTCVSCIGRWILYHWATKKAQVINIIPGKIRFLDLWWRQFQ